MNEEYIIHFGGKEHIQPNILKKTHVQIQGDNTPYGLWFCKPIIVKHFRIFGRKYYIKKNDIHHGKFESRYDEGILLGYSSRSKGYKCYNRMLQNIVECINFIDEPSTCTQIEEPTDDKSLPCTSQTVVEEGNTKASEEGNENTNTT